MNFAHTGPVTRKMFPFDDVIMSTWEESIMWQSRLKANASMGRQRCFVRGMGKITAIMTINAAKPCDAYLIQWTRSILVRVMVCHLLGVRLLTKPVLIYDQSDPFEQCSVIWNENTTHFDKKCLFFLNVFGKMLKCAPFFSFPPDVPCWHCIPCLFNNDDKLKIS